MCIHGLLCECINISSWYYKVFAFANIICFLLSSSLYETRFRKFFTTMYAGKFVTPTCILLLPLPYWNRIDRGEQLSIYGGINLEGDTDVNQWTGGRKAEFGG